MNVTRRQFVKGAAATAAFAGSHVLSFAARSAQAATNGNRVLVLVNLNGGNDALNTVIPLNNVGGAQRSLYQSLRPDLAIPTNLLGGLELGADPQLGTSLALHPQCAGLKTLYDEGKLAIVNGAGYPNSTLSHFDAEDVWFSGDVQGQAGTGWAGRHMDVTWGDGEAHALSIGQVINPSLWGQASDALGVRTIRWFALPDHPLKQYWDLQDRLPAWETIFGESRGGNPLLDAVSRSGANLVSKADVFAQIEASGWGSHGEDERWNLGQGFREVASVLRYDQANPGNATGVCFFHLDLQGFDTHSRQGTTDLLETHPALLDELSRTLLQFQRDLELLGLADQVVTVLYSEFGRRAAQNVGGIGAGTDHGAAGLVLVAGSPVAGGLHGRFPSLDDLDANGNQKVNTDFRRVYAAIVDDWLGGSSAAVLPGGPFAPLPLIA